MPPATSNTRRASKRSARNLAKTVNRRRSAMALVTVAPGWQTAAMPLTTPPLSPTRSADNLVWIDLEMTGLDASSDVVLQAALVVTSNELEILDEAAFDISQPDQALARMIPVVRAMHQKTGLIDRVRKATLSVAQVERALLEKVEAWCFSP